MHTDILIGDPFVQSTNYWVMQVSYKIKKKLKKNFEEKNFKK